MKVLYITNYGTMYGANKSLFTMMSVLKEQYNVEPYLLVSGRSGDIGKCCKKIGIPYFEHDFRISAIDEDTKHKALHKFTRYIMRYKEFYQIFFYMKKLRLSFDLVHDNSSIFDIGLFLAKKWKIPHVWHIREYAKVGCGLEMVYGENTVRRKYLESSLIIAVSDAIASWVRQLDDNINLKIVYNGINIPPIYEKAFCKNNMIHFCIIGSIVPRKNQLDVIKACEILLTAGKTNFHVYIVGDVGGEYYKEILKYLSEKTALCEHVTFTGYCDDVNAFLKDKDVGIMASDREAFGRVTVEYMANYMSVIGTNTGGTVELLKNIGILYSPHDINALAKAMIYYMDNPDVLEKNRQVMRNKAEMFGAEKNAEMIYDSYKEIMG